MSILINGLKMPQNIGRIVTIYPDGRVAESSIDGEQILGNAVEIADVHPVVGKWEDGNPYCPVCGEDKFKGLEADIWADWKPPFCPNCGVNMSETAIATNVVDDPDEAFENDDIRENEQRDRLYGGGITFRDHWTLEEQ